MYKVTASSVEEYFGFDPARTADLCALDDVIRSAAPTLARWFFPGTPAGKPGMTMTMIGYGRFEYTNQNSAELLSWPIIGVALQKNYLSLYYAARGAGDQPFTVAYAGTLGRVRISTTGVVTIAKMADVDLAGLTAMIRAIETGLLSGELTTGYGADGTP